MKDVFLSIVVAIVILLGLYLLLDKINTSQWEAEMNRFSLTCQIHQGVIKQFWSKYFCVDKDTNRMIDFSN